jgi:hypothetical protein
LDQVKLGTSTGNPNAKVYTNWFGAKPDQSADASGAMTACLDGMPLAGGVIESLPGDYLIQNSILVRGNTKRFIRFCGATGMGGATDVQVSTRLIYNGAANGTVIKAVQARDFEFFSFAIRSGGATIANGIDVDGPPASTNLPGSSNMIIREVYIEGTNTGPAPLTYQTSGIQIGKVRGDVDLITLYNCFIRGCLNGVSILGTQSRGNRIYDTTINACKYGIQLADPVLAVGGQGVVVHGTNFSANYVTIDLAGNIEGADVRINAAGGPYNFVACTSENSYRFLYTTFSATAGGPLVIRDSRLVVRNVTGGWDYTTGNPAPNITGGYIIYHAGGPLILEGNDFGAATPPAGSSWKIVVGSNNSEWGHPVIDIGNNYPIDNPIYIERTGSSVWATRLSFGNRVYDPSGQPAGQGIYRGVNDLLSEYNTNNRLLIGGLSQLSSRRNIFGTDPTPVPLGYSVRGTATFTSATAVLVALGTIVRGTDNVTLYKCIKPHLSETGLRPTTGTSGWQSFWAAEGTFRTVTDGAITSGSATLTSATAAFTSADVSKQVSISGAGPAGATLITTILTFVNATTVTVATAASTTVSGATVTIDGNTTWAAGQWYEPIEPDNNYFLTFGANVNQPFWWTAKTPSSFVINTTPAVTASVNWHLKR